MIKPLKNSPKTRDFLPEVCLKILFVDSSQPASIVSLLDYTDNWILTPLSEILEIWQKIHNIGLSYEYPILLGLSYYPVDSYSIEPVDNPINILSSYQKRDLVLYLI